MPANALLTPSIITRETLDILENNLVLAGRVNRKFENNFVGIGASLTIRKPNRFTVSSGPGLQVQGITEPLTSITINNQKHVDFQFSDQDLALTVEEFSERYCKPAAAALANQVDVDVISNFRLLYNLVGTAGTTPASFAALAAVGQRMDELAATQEGRTLVLGPAAYWSLANAFIGVYVKSVAESALKGFLANIANFMIFEDQNIQSQTVGALGGSGVTNGAGQTGSSLITNGWTASITNILNYGDVFTIAGVFAVNPQSRVSTNSLMQFVVTGNVSSDGSGNVTIPIYPAIVTSGAYQNVTAAPANGAAITPVGTSKAVLPQNLGFVKDTFGLVMVPLPIFSGVDFGARETWKNISIRIMRDWDINNDVVPTRMDILYGTTSYYPETGVRLTG